MIYNNKHKHGSAPADEIVTSHDICRNILATFYLDAILKKDLGLNNGKKWQLI